MPRPLPAPRSTAFRTLVAFALALAWAVGSAQARDPNEHFFQPFFGDLKAELDAARTQAKRGIVLVYEMEECPFCARFHATVLREAEVQDFYRKHFLVFRVDIKGATPVTGFDGRELTESAFAAARGVHATPTSVVYDLAGAEAARYTGPPRDAREFLLFGQYVLDGAHKAMAFSQYKLARAR
jgi:thioredoxin-related protein